MKDDIRSALLLREKITDEDGDLVELVVWRVTHSGMYPEGVRYRLAFIPKGHGKPAILYDNHNPKGHHRHRDNRQYPYHFTDVYQLRADFEKEIAGWKAAGRRKS